MGPMEGLWPHVLQKALGRGIRPHTAKKYSHLGYGCSPEGRRDRWLVGAPKLTYGKICEMLAAAAK
eukprot:5435109-Karenia_brevis.AAC.1